MFPKSASIIYNIKSGQSQYGEAGQGARKKPSKLCSTYSHSERFFLSPFLPPTQGGEGHKAYVQDRVAESTTLYVHYID